MAQSILGRVTQLARANINALLDGAEDPEKMLDQLVRDYTAAIQDATSAVAQTIGELRLTESDLAEANAAAVEWGNKAKAASRQADTFAEGTPDAERLNGLAKVALGRQVTYETTAKTLAGRVATDSVTVDHLKDGLNKMQVKLEDLRSNRDSLVARSKMAAAQVRVQTSISSISATDPTSELSRFEDRIRRQEAQAKGLDELASSSIDAQFDALDDSAQDAEVDARFAALKDKQPVGAGS